MAAEYYAVINEAEGTTTEAPGRKAGKEGKTLGTLKVARFVKMEAENVKDAQEAVATLYPGLSTGTPVVVAIAAWKTS
jgi:hypothetical protein